MSTPATWSLQDQGLHGRRGPPVGSAVRYLRDPQRSQFRGPAPGRGGTAAHRTRTHDCQAVLAAAAGPPVAGTRFAAPGRGQEIAAGLHLPCGTAARACGEIVIMSALVRENGPVRAGYPG